MKKIYKLLLIFTFYILAFSGVCFADIFIPTGFEVFQNIIKSNFYFLILYFIIIDIILSIIIVVSDKLYKKKNTAHHIELMQYITLITLALMACLLYISDFYFERSEIFAVIFISVFSIITLISLVFRIKNKKFLSYIILIVFIIYFLAEYFIFNYSSSTIIKAPLLTLLYYYLMPSLRDYL